MKFTLRDAFRTNGQGKIETIVPPKSTVLTSREKEVLRFVADGRTAQDIAATHGSVKVGGAISSLNPQPPTLHSQLSVQPNPFSNSTNIIFTIPQAENVIIVIYDLLGKEVKRFETRYQQGEHKIEWEGDAQNGSVLSAGLYQIRMRAGSVSKSVEVALVQ